MTDLEDRVLVDSGGFIGLSAVKSLGRRNVATTIMTQESFVPSLFSRFHPGTVYCTSPFENVAGFMMTLLQIVRRRKYVTIFPMCDQSLIPISEHRDQLTSYLNLTLPSHESILNALDKSRTLKAAEDLGYRLLRHFTQEKQQKSGKFQQKSNIPL